MFLIHESRQTATTTTLPQYREPIFRTSKGTENRVENIIGEFEKSVVKLQCSPNFWLELSEGSKIWRVQRWNSTVISSECRSLFFQTKGTSTNCRSSLVLKCPKIFLLQSKTSYTTAENKRTDTVPILEVQTCAKHTIYRGRAKNTAVTWDQFNFIQLCVHFKLHHATHLICYCCCSWSHDSVSKCTDSSSKDRFHTGNPVWTPVQLQSNFLFL